MSRMPFKRPHLRGKAAGDAPLRGEALTAERVRRARRARRRSVRRCVGRVVALVVVLACLAVWAVYINNLVGYLPAVACAALALVSGAYLLAARFSLAVESPGEAASCLRGRSVPLGVRLVNRGPLPLLGVEVAFFTTDLFGTEDVLSVQRVALAPFETHDFDFDVRFDHIGTYEAGLAYVDVRDLLGVFTARASGGARCRVEVQPRIFDVSDLHLEHDNFKERPDARRPFSTDGTDYTGVRGYELGDPMKRIHWKLAAHTEEYRTKIFETLGEPGVDVVLDFNSPAYDSEGLMSVFDSVVESALSVGAQAVACGMDCELVYRDRHGIDLRVGVNSGMTRGGFLASLPLVAAGGDGRELADLLHRECLSPEAQRNIVVCTASVDDVLVRELVNVKKARRNPMLIAVVPPALGTSERSALLARPLSALDAAGIRHMTVCAADDLEGGR